MRLYLRADLVKSGPNAGPEQKAGAGKPVDAKAGASGKSKGEQRGGSYVARTQTGYEKDGSPKYRYFRTEEEYESYLHNKGKSPQAKNLEDKVKKEHEDSKEKMTGHTDGSDDKKKDKKPGLLAKGLPLYIRI